jgi:hypothetical protein
MSAIPTGMSFLGREMLLKTSLRVIVLRLRRRHHRALISAQSPLGVRDLADLAAAIKLANDPETHYPKSRKFGGAGAVA